MTEQIELSNLTSQEAQDLMKRALVGDQTVLPEVRKIAEAVPRFAEQFGNLGEQVERAVVDRIAGSNLLKKEALTCQLREMHEQLAGPAPSYLEQMLAQEIVVCWLQARYEDIRAMQSSQNDAGQKRQDRAHKRFLNAVRELARLRKLLVPTLVQVNVGHRVQATQAEAVMVHREA